MRRLLDRFGDWFASDAGTVQTLLACLGIVAVELAFPRIDPHGFWLLYGLTVYSAVTQPALARSGRVAGERLQALADRIARMEAEELKLMKGTADAAELD